MFLGIGDWGLGIGDWAQSPIPNPQSPKTLTFILITFIKFKFKIYLLFYKSEIKYGRKKSKVRKNNIKI
jgi:hypothetical protein